MDFAARTFELKLERTITASPDEVFAAWIDPAKPGNPWNNAKKSMIDAKVDGLFYIQMGETPHYGRFLKLDKPRLLQHTWVSPYTEGHESTVTVTFAAKDNDTLMTLHHTGLPANERGHAHKEGWTYFMDLFPTKFAERSGNTNSQDEMREKNIMKEPGYRWGHRRAGGVIACVAIGCMFSLPVFIVPINAATGWSRTASREP